MLKQRGGGPGQPTTPLDPRYKWPEKPALLSTAVKRLDGPDKVTGRARYAYEVQQGPAVAYGYVVEASIGSPYQAIGELQRWVEWCRTVIARRPGTNVHAQAMLAIALKLVGADDEATAASEELLAASIRAKVINNTLSDLWHWAFP